MKLFYEDELSSPDIVQKQKARLTELYSANGYDIDKREVLDEEKFGKFIENEFNKHSRNLNSIKDDLYKYLGIQLGKSIMFEYYARYAKSKQEISKSYFKESKFIKRYCEVNSKDEDLLVHVLGYKNILIPEVLNDAKIDTIDKIKIIDRIINGHSTYFLNYDITMNFLLKAKNEIDPNDTNNINICNKLVRRLYVERAFLGDCERFASGNMTLSINSDDYSLLKILLLQRDADFPDMSGEEKFFWFNIADILISKEIDYDYDFFINKMYSTYRNNLNPETRMDRETAIKAIKSIFSLMSEYRKGELDLDYIRREMKRKQMIDLDFDNLSPDEQIQYAIEANIPIFIHGKPSHGKSSRARQIDPELTELNLSVIDRRNT